jgi:coenzyme F420-reducing hydrogenase delta subunit
MLLKNLITQLGTDPRRVRLEWISAAEGLKFAQVINDFTNEIKELGPYHTNGNVHSEVAYERPCP